MRASLGHHAARHSKKALTLPSPGVPGEGKIRPLLHLVGAFLMMSITTSALAQTNPSTRPAPDVRLTVHPAPLPRPALRYELLPPVAEMTDGPAVPLYLQAAELIRRRVDNFYGEGKRIDLGDLFALPIEQLPANADARKLFEDDDDPNSRERPLELLALAARRRDVDWGLPLREQGLATPMPYLYPIRELGEVAALRVRLLVAQGKFDDAVRMLQCALALARSLKEQALPVQSWTQAEISRNLARQIQEMIARPGCPNLYWALATLPRPFIDPAQDARWERAAILLQFPMLQDPARATLRQVQAVIDWTKHENSPQTPASQPSPWAVREGLALAGVYPEAKQSLTDLGVPADEVGRMPIAEAVTRYYGVRLRDALDERLATASLPFWQSRAVREQVADELDEQQRSVANPFSRFVGRYESSPAQYVALERQLATLQTIEALRAYAADHDGALPQSLDALATTTPAPIDPITGRPFDYETNGQTAIISSPSMRRDALPGQLLRTEVTLAPAASATRATK